ncbi:hypothetical protein C8R43DRAFT_941285 [Mycena crocata]|nr:hypothetical protein C8R43DRAFT_941285 [Mycena crocata]
MARMSAADKAGLNHACIHGLQGWAYALLGATDPYFLRALRELRAHVKAASFGTTGMHIRSKRFSMGSKALVRIDFEREVDSDRPSAETRGESRDEGPREPKSTPVPPRTEPDSDSTVRDIESHSSDGIACQLSLRSGVCMISRTIMSQTWDHAAWNSSDHQLALAGVLYSRRRKFGMVFSLLTTETSLRWIQT